MHAPQALSLGLAALVIAGVGGVTAQLLSADRAPAEDAALERMQESLRRLEGEMAAMRAERDSLSRALASLRAADAGHAPQRSTDLDALVAGAIEDYFAEHGAAGPGTGGEAAAGAAGAAPAADGSFAEASATRLMDARLSAGERDEIWKEVMDAGLVQEVIAELEAAVQADPGNLDLKVQLGYAYLQPIFSGEASMSEQGTWAMKADATYDEVLESDPRHWQARFDKAVSLAHWPPIFGKRPEAIRHFETLIEQQQSMAPEPHHAEVYLMLGNLHQQSGDVEQARAAWEKGLADFPDSEALRGALGDG